MDDQDKSQALDKLLPRHWDVASPPDTPVVAVLETATGEYSIVQITPDVREKIQLEMKMLRYGMTGYSVPYLNKVG